MNRDRTTTSTRRHARRLLIAATALALVVVACGGDDDRGDASTDTGGTAATAAPDDTGASTPEATTGGTEGTDATTPEGTSDDTTGGETPALEGVQGGSITYGMYGDAFGFDPVSTLDAPSFGGSAAIAIYDTIMRLDDDDQVVPYLADSLDTADGGTTWVLTLKQGITFQDGTAFDADAVVFNLERHLDPDMASAAAGLLAVIDTMTVTDDHTIEFVLNEPFADFPGVFLGRPGYIASPTAVEASGEDYGKNPVGVGPFRFVEWIPDDRIVLERNQEYWQDGLPYLDSITYRPMADPTTRIAAATTGEVDIAYFISALELNAAEDGGATMLREAGNGAETFDPNSAVAPFDDPRAVQAVAYATNYEAIRTIRYGSDVGAISSIFNEESPWYTDQSAGYPTFDLDRAKELVAEYEADTGGPLAFTVMSFNTPEWVTWSEAVQQMWQAAGMQVELEFLEPAAWIDRLNANDFQMIHRILAHFATPDPYVNRLVGTDGPSNSGYSNPDVDAALAEARGSLDEGVRQGAYATIADHITSDLPFVIWGPTIQGFAMNARLRGVDEASTRDMTLYAGEIWLEQ